MRLPNSDLAGENATRGLARLPFRLGEFNLTRLVGRGGMGRVFEAIQTTLNRRVAVKILPSDFSGNLRERFRREAHLLASLDHKGIVSIYGFYESPGLCYYAMEYVEGVTLKGLIALVRGGGVGARSMASAAVSEAAVQHADPSAATRILSRGDRSDSADGAVDSMTGLRETEHWVQQIIVLYRDHPNQYCEWAADICLQVAEALSYAHGRGIVHRDVKPGNIMVMSDGKAKLCDFGLAAEGGSVRLTLTGDFLGTPAYMSPEQVAAKRIPIDHRTDIYSLCVSLYELVTLRSAFEGESRQILLSRILFSQPLRPRKIRRSVPADLEAIVIKGMSKNPSERYETAAELADDLARYRRGHPVGAKRPTLMEPIRRWWRNGVRKYGKLQWATILSGVISSASLVWLFFLLVIMVAGLRWNFLGTWEPKIRQSLPGILALGLASSSVMAACYAIAGIRSIIRPRGKVDRPKPLLGLRLMFLFSFAAWVSVGAWFLHIEVQPGYSNPLGSARDRLHKVKDVQFLGHMVKDKNSTMAILAAEELGRRKDARGTECLIAGIEDGRIKVREAVLSALGQTRDPRAVPPLIHALGDGEPRVCWWAAIALGDIKDTRAIAPLIARLKGTERDWNVRDKMQHSSRGPIVVALAKIGKPSLEPLIRALKDTDPGVRSGAASALGEIGDPRAVEPLIALSEDPHSLVRRDTAVALGSIADLRAVNPLIHALADKEPDVRSCAATALGASKSPQAVAPLIAVLMDAHADVRRSAANALYAITGKYFGEDPVKWRAWWEQNKEKRPKAK